MKISEAMKAGRQRLAEQNLTQITGAYCEPGSGACAAGMAFIGNGLSAERVAAFAFDEIEEMPEFDEQVPWVLLPEQYRQLHTNPHDPALLTLVITLNDAPYLWPVNNIIAYLESIGR